MLPSCSNPVKAARGWCIQTAKCSLPPIFVVGRDRAAQEGQLDVNSDLIGGRPRGTQVSDTASKRIFVAREAEESSPIYPMLIFPLGVWMQENLRCVFRHVEWRRRFWVATELRKHGSIILKMSFECPYPRAIGRMVRQKLRELAGVGILKILKQPGQSPRVKTCLSTNV